MIRFALGGLAPSPDSEDLDRYVHGRCHLYALARAAAFGETLHALWDTGALDDECNALPTCLVHMWTVDAEGQAWDARGRLDVDTVVEEFQVSEPTWARHTIAEVEVLMHDGVLDTPEPGEMAQLDAEVRERKLERTSGRSKRP